MPESFQTFSDRLERDMLVALVEFYDLLRVLDYGEDNPARLESRQTRWVRGIVEAATGTSISEARRDLLSKRPE